MKPYEDYRLWEGSYYDPLCWEPLLRDILAELERLGKRMDDLENEELGFPPAITAIQEMCMALQDVIHATEDRMDARLAKLEQGHQCPIPRDQQIAFLYAEISTLDKLMSMTPAEDVIDLNSLKSRKKQVQEELAKLEEGSS